MKIKVIEPDAGVWILGRGGPMGRPCVPLAGKNSGLTGIGVSYYSEGAMAETKRITGAVEFNVTVERSRFFAVLFPAASEEDVLNMVRRKKGEHRKANHHCWAFRVQDGGGIIREKSKDDGEVGHPGRVLLEILRREGLQGGILVSRIFGGVKLGVGGVSRAFRQAGEGALSVYLQNRK